MARYAVIDGTSIVNVIEAEPGFALEGFSLVASDEAGPGWTYDGAFHRPAEPEPAAASQITPRQARLALLSAGLLASVNAAVASADEATQIAWDYATVINRDNAIIAAMAAQLGLSSAQVDDLFRLALTFD